MGLKFSQLPIASSVAADDYIAVLDSSESVLKRTPISHASAGTEYGVATTSAYGHTKIVDNLSQSSLTSGEALSSRQGNVIANDMGVVELSTTAAHTHAVGDFFMLIGQFVKCTKAIAVGNTINIGTNVATTNIGEVLSQLNSKVGSSALQSGKTLTSLMGNSAIPSGLGTTVTGALANIPFRFGIDSAGNYGYKKAGADTVIPFKSGAEKVTDYYNTNGSVSTRTDITVNYSSQAAGRKPKVILLAKRYYYGNGGEATCYDYERMQYFYSYSMGTVRLSELTEEPSTSTFTFNSGSAEGCQWAIGVYFGAS